VIRLSKDAAIEVMNFLEFVKEYARPTLDAYKEQRVAMPRVRHWIGDEPYSPEDPTKYSRVIHNQLQAWDEDKPLVDPLLMEKIYEALDETPYGYGPPGTFINHLRESLMDPETHGNLVQHLEQAKAPCCVKCGGHLRANNEIVAVTYAQDQGQSYLCWQCVNSTMNSVSIPCGDPGCWRVETFLTGRNNQIPSKWFCRSHRDKKVEEKKVPSVPVRNLANALGDWARLNDDGGIIINGAPQNLEEVFNANRR
jgi:hypothetical protein